MLRFFAGHPTAANLLMLAFLFIGLVTIPTLKRDTFPEIDKYEVQINVVYPGAAPSDVEDGICRPLEDATNSISFIDELRCEARTNSGVMTIKMQQEGEFKNFLDDIRSAVDGIDNFPLDAKTPIITELGRTTPVVTVALHTQDNTAISAGQLKDLAEAVKAKMLQDPGIPLVTLEGFSQRQLRVEIKDHILRRYSISTQDVASILQKQNINLPLGTLQTGDKDYNLRFFDERITAQGLAQVVILSADNGAEITLGDIAIITDTFEKEEEFIVFDGQRAALLKVAKNSNDDSLNILANVKTFIENIKPTLPAGLQFTLTQNNTSIVKDRLMMLLDNTWQGLILVFLTLMLFFGVRYSFWVIMGLPVSFLGAMYVISLTGISINMMSTVALLLALGILMDDAIVIAESVAAQRQAGKSPLDAVVDGTARVARGVASSFLTTVFMFGSMIGLQGDLGQVLKVIPIVLIIVISVSLIEAFFILPNHLFHTMSKKDQHDSGLQIWVNKVFENARDKLGVIIEKAIAHRYAVIGSTIATLLICISLLISGVLKFNALPAIDGDVLEARLTMPSGTPLAETRKQVDIIMAALKASNVTLSKREPEPLVRHTNIQYGKNVDAFETGPHLVTISVDLLTAQQRSTTIDDIISSWQKNTPALPGIVSLIFTEPALGPSGRAIDIRLSGLKLENLSQASFELRQFLGGYTGVYNVFDDLRPGKPELFIRFKNNARALNIDAQAISNQLRGAFNGIIIDEVYRPISVVQNNQYRLNSADNVEIVVQLNQDLNDPQSLNDLRNFPIIHPISKKIIPLSSLVTFENKRNVSRIQRIGSVPTVSVFGSINKLQANTTEVINDLQKKQLPALLEKFPGLKVNIEGEVKNGKITQTSLKNGLLIGLVGVFILLSFQFRSYAEPLIVMISIPMALIGVILGHLLMGHNMAMPSMIGFVSLAGIVVNDAILLVEFVKHHVAEGLDLHTAARQASQDRMRAILLTTLTTVAGMLPLLFETSLQAQILIPLVISISFGLLVSTLLILIVLPCLYTVLQDFKGNKPT
ncbi:MAG: efflux RND transporter permease subunit [Bermanella sp.]